MKTITKCIDSEKFHRKKAAARVIPAIALLYSGNACRIKGPEISAGSLVKTKGVMIAAKKNIPPIISDNKNIPAISKICKLLMVPHISWPINHV